MKSATSCWPISLPCSRPAGSDAPPDPGRGGDFFRRAHRNSENRVRRPIRAGAVHFCRVRKAGEAAFSVSAPGRVSVPRSRHRTGTGRGGGSKRTLTNLTTSSAPKGSCPHRFLFRSPLPRAAPDRCILTVKRSAPNGSDPKSLTKGTVFISQLSAAAVN